MQCPRCKRVLPESMGERKVRAEVAVAEVMEPEADMKVPICPEDGNDMIWNKTLKRWECECGYRWKVEK